MNRVCFASPLARPILDPEFICDFWGCRGSRSELCDRVGRLRPIRGFDGIEELSLRAIETDSRRYGLLRESSRSDSQNPRHSAGLSLSVESAQCQAAKIRSVVTEEDAPPRKGDPAVFTFLSRTYLPTFCACSAFTTTRPTSSKQLDCPRSDLCSFWHQRPIWTNGTTTMRSTTISNNPICVGSR